MAEEMDQLLQQLRGGEGRLDSQGEFLLDLSRAREKLRKFQLAEPAFYLLKLVQAAVSAGTTGLHIRLGRRDVQVRFGVPRGDNRGLEDSATLLKALTAPPSAAANKTLAHLGVALNSAWGMEPQRIQWCAFTGQGGWQLTIGREDMRLDEVQEIPRWAGDLALDWFRFYLERPATLKNYVRGVASEHHAVISRCAFSCAPITLDSKRLVGSWGPPPSAGWHAGISPPFYLLERYELSAEGPLEFAFPEQIGRPEDGQFLVTRPVEGDQATRFPTFCVDINGARPGQRLLCHTALAVPLALTGPGRAYFVQDGVTLDPLESNLGLPGMVAITGGDGLRVDLSEFGVVHDEVLLDRIERLRERATSAKGLLLKLLHRVPCHKLRDDSQAAASVGTLVGCALGGPVGALLVGWLVRSLTARFGGGGDEGQLQAAIRRRLEG